MSSPGDAFMDQIATAVANKLIGNTAFRKDLALYMVTEKVSVEFLMSSVSPEDIGHGIAKAILRYGHEGNPEARNLLNWIRREVQQHVISEIGKEVKHI